MSRKIKRASVLLIIFVFTFYLFFNIFYLKRSNEQQFYKPAVNTNKLDSSIINEYPFYNKKYFVKAFLNDILNNLYYQDFPSYQNVYANFYFNNEEIYVKINFLDENYIYHYYLI